MLGAPDILKATKNEFIDQMERYSTIIDLDPGLRKAGRLGLRLVDEYGFWSREEKKVSISMSRARGLAVGG